MFCNFNLSKFGCFMYKKIILITSFFISFTIGKSYSISPVVKSLIMPGWGEKALDNSKRARLFSNIEISLWTACIGSYTFSYHQMLKYKSFAVEHAGIPSTGRHEKYWVDIGNYIDIDAHNNEHLRWRYIDELYDESAKWLWDSRKNMKKFEDMRIRSDYYAKTGEYIIGAIVLNHLISGIDALYLLRLENITFLPIINNGTNELSLNIRF